MEILQQFFLKTHLTYGYMPSGFVWIKRFPWKYQKQHRNVSTTEFYYMITSQAYYVGTIFNDFCLRWARCTREYPWCTKFLGPWTKTFRRNLKPTKILTDENINWRKLLLKKNLITGHGLDVAMSDIVVIVFPNAEPYGHVRYTDTFAHEVFCSQNGEVKLLLARNWWVLWGFLLRSVEI